MVAADANGMVARHRFDAETKDVVLQRSLKISKVDPLAFGDHKIHGEKNDGGTVDGHRYADPIKRNVAKKGFHIRQGVDGHAASSNLASGSGIVGVVTHESRHVEGN